MHVIFVDTSSLMKVFFFHSEKKKIPKISFAKLTALLIFQLVLLFRLKWKPLFGKLNGVSFFNIKLWKVYLRNLRKYHNGYSQQFLVKMVNFIDNTQKINFSMKVPINNVLKRSQKSLQITPDLCTFTEEILAGKL